MHRVEGKSVIRLLLLVSISITTMAEAAEVGETLADVNGVAITSDEVEKALGAPLVKLQEQVYSMKRRIIETLINDRLLASEAAKRGVTAMALLDAEVTAKVGLVTEQEIETVYKSHKAQVQADEETVREQIRSRLQMQKLTAQREKFLDRLRSQANVTVHLKAPPIFRVAINTDGAPFKGPALAPVTIVKFEDFYCPYCRRVQAGFTELLARYGDKTRLVHLDFPLDEVHPAARKAHEAARCAHEQGKFWTYHDLLYSSAPKSNQDFLRTYAEEARLDMMGFDQCLSSGKYQETVQKDVEEGRRLGITATPVFFINGRQLVGAQPLEIFSQLIDDELARVQNSIGGSERAGQ